MWLGLVGKPKRRKQKNVNSTRKSEILKKDLETNCFNSEPAVRGGEPHRRSSTILWFVDLRGNAINSFLDYTTHRTTRCAFFSSSADTAVDHKCPSAKKQNMIQCAVKWVSKYTFLVARKYSNCEPSAAYRREKKHLKKTNVALRGLGGRNL